MLKKNTSLSEMCHTLCVTSPSGLYFFSAFSTLYYLSVRSLTSNFEIELEFTDKFMKDPVWWWWWCFWPVVS